MEGPVRRASSEGHLRHGAVVHRAAASTYPNRPPPRDIEELDTKETAEALGLTENAVKIRLHRARQALRQLLDPHMTGGLS
jgi:hypothetical protein